MLEDEEELFSFLKTGLKPASGMFKPIAEQNNSLLLKNHKSRLTGSIPLPEANATIQVNRRGRGHGHGYYCQGRDRGRGRYNS